MRTKLHLRIVGPASDLPKGQRFCTCCERPLRGKVAYLELEEGTARYTDSGLIPPERSQGWFPFGLTCAAKELRRETDQTFRIAQIIARREKNI